MSAPSSAIGMAFRALRRHRRQGSDDETVSNAGYAWQLWPDVLNSPADIEIGITVASVGRANGASASSACLAPDNGQTLYQGGAGRGGRRDGRDPRPRHHLHPASGAAPVIPTTRTDAVSVLVHEFGDGLGFDGCRDGTTGALPGSDLDTVDLQVGNPGGGPVRAYRT